MTIAESIQLNKEQIARAFGVPAHMLADPDRTAVPRYWSLCMTSENHGTVGPAGCTFSHAPDKHERVLVVEVPTAAGAPVDQVNLQLVGARRRRPVAEFKGYIDGQPAVTWLDRDNMPRVGTKLFSAPVESPSAPVGASIDTPEFVGLLGAWVGLCAEDEGITEYERLSAKAWASLITHIDQHVAREVAAQAGQVALPEAWAQYKRELLGAAFDLTSKLAAIPTEEIGDEGRDLIRREPAMELVTQWRMRVDAANRKFGAVAAPSPAKESK